jgi:hypothetical protein
MFGKIYIKILRIFIIVYKRRSLGKVVTFSTARTRAHNDGPDLDMMRTHAVIKKGCCRGISRVHSTILQSLTRIRIHERTTSWHNLESYQT